MKLGVQLYGSMHLYHNDPQKYLKDLKNAGYEIIEPCILFEGAPTNRGWRAEEFSCHAKLVKENAQKMISAHIIAEDFSKCTDEIVSIAKQFEIKAMVVGFNGPFTNEEVEDFSKKCLKLIEKLQPVGTELWLQNCGAEIRTKLNKITAYEAVLKYCDGRLGAQVDTGWVVCGGENLEDFLNRNAEYIRSIHHKDIFEISQNLDDTQNVAIGDGIVDNKTAYNFAVKHNLGQLVDLDNAPGDFIEALAKSSTYLNKF